MASVVINTRFNNRKAEADLKELQAKAKETAREIDAVEKGLGSATTKRNKLRDDLEAARQKAAETVAALDEVNARLDAGRKSKFGVTSKGDETLSDKQLPVFSRNASAVFLGLLEHGTVERKRCFCQSARAEYPLRQESQ